MASCFNKRLPTGKFGKVSARNTSLQKEKLHRGLHLWKTAAKTSSEPAAKVPRLLTTRATAVGTTKANVVFKNFATFR